jgi:hypothetical protein
MTIDQQPPCRHAVVPAARTPFLCGAGISVRYRRG